MEGDLTIEELTEAQLTHMNRSSSPWIGGFTLAYMRVFWHVFKYGVKDSLNSIQNDQISQTLRGAIIKLFRKGSKICMKLETTDQSICCQFSINYQTVALPRE